MTEEVAKIKANKNGTYIDIVPEKCVSAQKAQYDENGRDLLDAESSQTIKGANTFAAKQTFTGGTSVSGTNAIAGNVNMDSGAIAIGSAVTIENHGKITADNTSNTLKVANHDSVLTGNDVLSAKDIMSTNGDANNLLHRSGTETAHGEKTFVDNIIAQAFVINRTNESVTPSVNKVFQIEVDSNDGFTHYISFNSLTDGSRSVNIVIGDGSNVEGYFNLTKLANGNLAIYTNFPKPENW